MSIAASPVSRHQLGRLLQLILVLRAGRYPNATALARICEVSRRTVYRDLQSLATGGVPVRFRQDLGGYEIEKGFFLESPRLEESEAIALVLQALRPGPQSGPDRSEAAYWAIQKIAQALPESYRDRILALIAAVRVPSPIPQADESRIAIHQAVVAAVAARRTIRIWFREPSESSVVSTKFSPIRLNLVGDNWQLTGRSSLHRKVEMIRLAWIVRVSEMSEPATDLICVPEHRPRPGSRQVARLRFAAQIAAEILDGRFPLQQEIETREDGSLDMVLYVEQPETQLSWILSFGKLVEVLGPAWLRKQVCETAHSIAANHAPLDQLEPSPEELRAVDR